MTTQPTQPENNDAQVTVVEEPSASNSPATSEAAEGSASIQIQDVRTSPFTAEEEVQPFTAFIKEFRQKEEWPGLPDAINPVPTMDNSGRPAQSAEQTESAPAQETPVHAETAESDAIYRVATAPTPPPQPERPVSPLLRPATRIRMPRQGGGRQREAFVTQGSVPSSTTSSARPSDSTKSADATHQAPAESLVAQVESTPPTVEEVKVEQSESPRPARRYRFDRPAPAAHSTVSPKPVADAINRVPTTSSPTEPAGTLAAGARPHAENTQPEQAPKTTDALNRVPTETRLMAPETVVATPESEVKAANAPATRPNNDRRRRQSQEGQHVKARASVDSIKDALKAEAIKRVPAVTPVVEQPTPVAKTETAADALNRVPTEIPVEDLPPLEYADLQAASRRRRRRRTNGTTTAPTPTAKPMTQVVDAMDAINRVPTPSQVVPAPIAPIASAIAARNGDAINRVPTVTPLPNTPPTPYTIQSGVTVSQMNQGNDATGPFQGPEPTPARGSVLPTHSRLVRPMRNGNEAQRGSMPAVPAVRSGDGLVSPGAVNHLANVISQAIQLQSDRMVAELRRSNQTPASISVTLPPFPSTERVGVFVDVANLLYSARTLRMTIDFGKLLDFLRGNRRLVRAHAYCPTSPQPGDDQMFLQAVKGLGYRITTKNYKTFASGAKKADMDLDLCMDVVRLVDGGAVDCVVLVSGDGDFIPMLDYCSDHGVRVEVVAFDESMSATLRQSCDLFINLSMLDEIRVP